MREDAHPGIQYGITHAYGTNVETMEALDADIILARGLTRHAIQRERMDATVLELRVSAYDVLRAIHRCRKEYGAKRIAVVGLESILYDLDTFKDGDLPHVMELVNSMKVSRADIAEMLGISRTTLWRKTKKKKNNENAT